jgi:hypothetical protein
VEKEFLQKQQQKIWGFWRSGLFERLNIKNHRLGLTLQKAHAHGFRAVRS